MELVGPVVVKSKVAKCIDKPLHVKKTTPKNARLFVRLLKY